MNSSLKPKIALGVLFSSLFLSFFSGALVLGIGIYSNSLSEKSYTFLSFIIGQGFMLVPLLWFLKIRKEPVFKRLRIKPVKKETLVLTFFLSIGIIILSDELDRLIQIIIPAPDYILDLGGLLKPESLTDFLMLFIAVGIIAPFGEELLFRGFFQQILEKNWKDITRAILITALIFSFIHMNPYWFAQIYLLGIVLGFLAWKTKSVIPPLILHSLNNIVALIFSSVNLETSSIYIWNGHVAPWFIFIAFVWLYIGFSGINKIKL